MNKDAIELLNLSRNRSFGIQGVTDPGNLYCLYQGKVYRVFTTYYSGTKGYRWRIGTDRVIADIPGNCCRTTEANNEEHAGQQLAQPRISRDKFAELVFAQDYNMGMYNDSPEIKTPQDLSPEEFTILHDEVENYFTGTMRDNWPVFVLEYCGVQ